MPRKGDGQSGRSRDGGGGKGEGQSGRSRDGGGGKPRRSRGKGREGREAAEERKKKKAEEERLRLEAEEAERQRIAEEERLAAEAEAEEERLAAEAAERRRLEEEAEVQRVAEVRGLLREANLAAGAERPELPKTVKADIKKCSGFVKKLQKVSLDSKDALTREFAGLNLSRYISEAVDNLCESKLKASDVFACVEVRPASSGLRAWAQICSLFHQRYADFTPLLVPAIIKMCSPSGLAQEEIASTVNRRRTLLRWLLELVVCGVWTDRIAVIKVVAETVKADLEDEQKQFVNLPITVAIGRTSGYLFLPHSEELVAECPVGPTDVFSTQEKEILNKGLNKLFGSLVDALGGVHRELKLQEQANRKMLEGGGQMNVEALQAYTELRSVHDKLVDNATSVAQVLRREIPEFEEEEEPAAPEEEPEDEGVDEDDEEAPEVIWDDVELRSFYVSLPELRSLVPEVMFADTEPEEAESAAEHGVFDNLVAQLPKCENKEAIDQWTIQFCGNNAKQLRARLVNHILDNTVTHQKMHNIPYLARGVAALTLKGLFSDIGPPISEQLLKQFLEIQKATKWSPQDKRRLTVTVKFLSELVNFRVAQPQSMFELLRVCLDDFSRSIELACLALEVCGHFLYRNPETQESITKLVELMFKVKNSNENVDEAVSLMVDNAYNTCKPPVLINRDRNQKPPLHQYIEKLLFKDVGKLHIDKVERQLRKLPWAECHEFLVASFTDARKLKFNHISNLAHLVGKLGQFHESFGINVADKILEDIRYSMEVNRWEDMQNRITTVKFLGELYVYRLVDSQAIFDTLGLLITLGYTQSRASGCAAPDPPEDFTRVRLVCTLLDAVGPYFTKGYSRKRLDIYLKYFQRYVLSKPTPPVDVIFGVADVFESLRPKMNRYETYDEACQDIEKLEAQEAKSEKLKGKMQEKAMRGTNAREVMAMDTIEEDDEAPEEDGGEDGGEDRGEDEDPGDESEDEDEDASDGAETKSAMESDEEPDTEAVDLEEDEHIFYRNIQAVKEMEDDFDREFRQMMNESLTDRKSKGAPAAFTDSGVPLSFERAKPRIVARDDDDDSDEEESEPTMQFQMLTRKGQKQISAHSLEVPLQCAFAAKTLAKEQAEMREREELTAKVLAYENHEAQVAHQEALARRQQRKGGPNKNHRQRQQQQARQQQQQAAAQYTPSTPTFPYERQ